MTLDALTEKYTDVAENGFSIHLGAERELWDAAIRAVGRRSAYRQMAEQLCRMHRERFGREFLFTERCMAFEIRFHADAYLSVTVGGYPRHVGTLPFSRDALISHCCSIEIDVDDVRSLRQRLMFRYRFGLRPCYRKTKYDPFLPFCGLKPEIRANHDNYFL